MAEDVPETSPSGVQLAEHCPLANALAKQYPETSRFAVKGTNIHLEIKTGVATSPQGEAGLTWLEGRKVLALERRVELLDPETGERINGGIVDAAIDENGLLVVVDWKSGQRAYVTAPDDNLQLHNYALALAQELGYDRYQLCLVFLSSEGKAEEIRSKVIEGNEQWLMLHRIKDVQGRAPKANPGPWCNDCWQSAVCPSFRERVKLSLALLDQDIDRGPTGHLPTLTNEQATQLVLRLEAIKEALKVAKDMVEGHVRAGGRVEWNGRVWAPIEVAGNTVADLDALRKAGLTGYIRKSKPYQRFLWKKTG